MHEANRHLADESERSGRSDAALAGAVSALERSQYWSVSSQLMRIAYLRGLPPVELVAALSPSYKEELIAELVSMDDSSFDDVAPVVREALADDAELRRFLIGWLSSAARQGDFADEYRDGERLRGVTYLSRYFGEVPDRESVEHGRRRAVARMRVDGVEAWGELEGKDLAEAFRGISKEDMQASYAEAMEAFAVFDIRRAASLSGVAPRLEGRFLAAVTSYRHGVAEAVERDDDENREYTLDTLDQVFPGHKEADFGDDPEARALLVDRLFTHWFADVGLDSLASAHPEIAEWPEYRQRVAAQVAELSVSSESSQYGSDFAWKLRALCDRLRHFPTAFDAPSRAWIETAYEAVSRDLRSAEALVEATGIPLKSVLDSRQLQGLYSIDLRDYPHGLPVDIDEAFYARHGLDGDWEYGDGFWEVVRVAQYWKRARVLVGESPDPSVIDFDGAEHVLSHPEYWDVFIAESGIDAAPPEAWMSRVPRERWVSVDGDSYRGICRSLGLSHAPDAMENDKVWYAYLEDISRKHLSDSDRWSLSSVHRLLMAMGAGQARPDLLSRAVSDVFRQGDWYYQNRGWGVFFDDLEKVPEWDSLRTNRETLGPLMKKALGETPERVREFAREWKQRGYQMDLLHEQFDEQEPNSSEWLRTLEALESVGEQMDGIVSPQDLIFAVKAFSRTAEEYPAVAAMCRRSPYFSEKILSHLFEKAPHVRDWVLLPFASPSAMDPLGSRPMETLDLLGRRNDDPPDGLVESVAASPAAFGFAWGWLLASRNIEALEANFGNAVPTESFLWRPAAVIFLKKEIGETLSEKEEEEGTRTGGFSWLERVLDRDAFVQVGSGAVKAMIEESLLGNPCKNFVEAYELASLAEEKFPDLFLEDVPDAVRAAAARRVVRVLEGTEHPDLEGALRFFDGATLPSEVLTALRARMATEAARGKIDLAMKLAEWMGVPFVRFEDPDAFIDVVRQVDSGGYGARALAVLYRDFRPLGNDAQLIERFSEVSELSAVVVQASKLRGPAAREDFCPYRKQLEPMWSAIPERLRNTSIMPFFETFGLKNLPVLAETYTDLVAADAEGVPLPQVTQDRLRKYLAAVGREGLWAEGVADVSAILESLRETVRALRKEIYLDRLPAGIETSDLLMEVLNAGFEVTGSYGNYRDRVERIKTWRETYAQAEREGAVERVRVPEGMVPASYRVSLIGRSGKTEGGTSGADPAGGVDRSNVEEAISAEIQKEPFLNFVRPWSEAFRSREGGAEAVFDDLEAGFRDELSRRRRELDGTDAEKEAKKAKGLAFAIRGIEERLKKVQDARIGLAGMTGAESFRAAFERIVGALGKDSAIKLAGPCLYRLAVGIAEAQAPQHVSEIRRHLVGREDGISADSFEALRAWMLEEVLEHVMDPRGEAWAGRPMSPEAFSVLRSLFRLDPAMVDAVKRRLSGEVKAATPLGHPFFDAVAKVAAQERRLRGETVEGDALSVAYYPVHGIGRILASDVGAACYNKYNTALAKNEYPGINAVIMAMDAGADEAAFGSTLFIDARSPGGEPVLVVRAINPSQASVERTVSAAGIVETTIDYAIRTAKARGIRRVDMCVSVATAHATNRIPVSEAIYAYGRKHQLSYAGRLQSTPETNFNGYAIWEDGKRYTVWTEELS